LSNLTQLDDTEVSREGGPPDYYFFVVVKFLYALGGGGGGGGVGVGVGVGGVVVAAVAGGGGHRFRRIQVETAETALHDSRHFVVGGRTTKMKTHSPFVSVDQAPPP